MTYEDLMVKYFMQDEDAVDESEDVYEGEEDDTEEDEEDNDDSGVAEEPVE